MELHKAIKEIIASKGAEMICNPQIIYYLLDFRYHRIKYDMQSAPLWVFMLPSAIMAGTAILICIVMKLLIRRKLK